MQNDDDIPTNETIDYNFLLIKSYTVEKITDCMIKVETLNY